MQREATNPLSAVCAHFAPDWQQASKRRINKLGNNRIVNLKAAPLAMLHRTLWISLTAEFGRN